MMMKKIKSIKQLRAEKRRMKQEQQDLEKKIRGNWQDVKEAFRPANMAKDAMNSMFKNRTGKNAEDDNILKNTFTYGISVLARKFADNAGERISRIFKK